MSLNLHSIWPINLKTNKRLTSLRFLSALHKKAGNDPVNLIKNKSLTLCTEMSTRWCLWTNNGVTSSWEGLSKAQSLRAINGGRNTKLGNTEK